MKQKMTSAFTLAEVLITLGIIGIVAAMTLPTVINKSQEFILRNQYKKAYSTFLNAILLVQAKMDYPINCYYWDSNPYGGTSCVEYNNYGSCKKWTLADGSPLPSSYSGQFSDCKTFDEMLFSKILTTVAFCANNALEKGCLTDKYKGIDKVKLENGAAEDSVDPNQLFSDSVIKNQSAVWILTNGIVVIKYAGVGARPIYTLDINGHKGPNRWGYDIFSFDVRGNTKYGIKRLFPITYATEKGGKTGGKMYQEALTK